MTADLNAALSGPATVDPFAGLTDDPFAALADAPESTPAQDRTALLDDALRGYCPLRKVFVQNPNTSTVRASTLAMLVTGRHHRPLDALLLLHALQPILDGSPLALGTWARLLSTRTVCTPVAASRAFDTLVGLKLITRTGSHRTPVLQPLLDDASGKPWSRPGMVEEEGPGYFTIPHSYWTTGLVDQLTLPGKAMMLICLAETQNPKTPAFAMAVERAPGWYGISERTAERGYSELGKAGVLLVRKTKVADPRHPAGRRDVYWRALASPYGTADRARLQKAANQRRSAKTAQAQAEGDLLATSPATSTVTGVPQEGGSG